MSLNVSLDLEAGWGGAGTHEQVADVSLCFLLSQGKFYFGLGLVLTQYFVLVEARCSVSEFL